MLDAKLGLRDEHRVRIVFDHPEPSPIVEIKRDRSPQVGLTSEERDLESSRSPNAVERLLRRKRNILRILRVDDTLGEVIGGPCVVGREANQRNPRCKERPSCNPPRCNPAGGVR